MQPSLPDKVIIKVFAGYLVTSELRMHLNESQAWKNVSVRQTPDPLELKEAHYKDKDYIGIFFTHDTFTIADLKATDAMLRQKLSAYCPKYNADLAKICSFPQLFLA